MNDETLSNILEAAQDTSWRGQIMWTQSVPIKQEQAIEIIEMLYKLKKENKVLKDYIRKNIKDD